MAVAWCTSGHRNGEPCGGGKTWERKRTRSTEKTMGWSLIAQPKEHSSHRRPQLENTTQYTCQGEQSTTHSPPHFQHSKFPHPHLSTCPHNSTTDQKSQHVTRPNTPKQAQAERKGKQHTLRHCILTGDAPTAKQICNRSGGFQYEFWIIMENIGLQNCHKPIGEQKRQFISCRAARKIILQNRLASRSRALSTTTLGCWSA